MEALNLGNEKIFLTSKVARRTFMMFILCAILPLLTISAVSLFFVGNQLRNEAEQRLQQQCKNKGFLIYERLITLEQELMSISTDYRHEHVEKITKTPYDPINREGSGWKRILLKTPQGRAIPIFEHTGGPAQISLDGLEAPDDNRAMIKVAHGADVFPTILMIKNLSSGSGRKGVLVGEIDPLYLWGIGIAGALPPGFEFSVVFSRKKILVSSIQNDLISEEFLAAQKQDAFSGAFENTKNGKTYINSYWSLFLKHRFSSADWTICIQPDQIVHYGTGHQFLVHLLPAAPADILDHSVPVFTLNPKAHRSHPKIEIRRHENCKRRIRSADRCLQRR